MWPEGKAIQLPGWIPWLTLRETAWVRHGFLLPFRAAHSKPKREQGISCRCENTDLRVCVMPSGIPSYVLLFAYDGVLSQCVRETSHGSLVADVGTGRALPASRLDPALELTWDHRAE